jgi:predicted nuclease of predicted toxin-antitoxin system
VRFFIDANMPRSIVALMTQHGHEVEFARDVGLGSAPDEQIAARAQATLAALITRDLDFSDVRAYPPEKYSGIVVVRVPDGALSNEIALVVERFLREPLFITNLNGRLAIVEPDRVRFRPPLNSI